MAGHCGTTSIANHSAITAYCIVFLIFASRFSFFASETGCRNPSCSLVKYNLRFPQISVIFVFHFSDCLASFSDGETQAFLSDFDELSRIPKVQHELQKYNTSSHGFRQPAPYRELHGPFRERILRSKNVIQLPRAPNARITLLR